jgi:flagellar hook protein FlgE
VLRSLFSGIAGLRQHQTMMDVVANNIANVNTTGFKSSSVVFEDTLSQMVRASAAPTPDIGGINPAQVGLGVQLGAIGTNFAQGSAQTTNRPTDLMIQGDGFFLLKKGAETVYTRAGDFNFDSDGRLVNPEGMIVQGWMGTNGVINTNGSVGDIVIPSGSLIPPVASTAVTVTGNISSSTAIGDTITLGATVYDDAGNSHSLIMTLTKTSDTDFTADLSENGSPVGSSGSITFNPDGTIATETDPTVQLTASGPTLTVSLAGATQFGGPKSISVVEADGSAAGTLQQFQIGADGVLIGVFSNGIKQPMATIAVANFNNPVGLEKLGNSTYGTSTNSGLPQVGTPGSGGRGTLIGGALEMSNVNLAEEFTALIVAQRGFQANSRVITSSDEMLQDLVNIKR